MDAEKFLDFGEKHPEFYLRFEKVALQLIAQGPESLLCLCYSRLSTHGNWARCLERFPAFKLSNNFRKELALKFAKKHLVAGASFVSAIADNGLQLRKNQITILTTLTTTTADTIEEPERLDICPTCLAPILKSWQRSGWYLQIG